MQICVSGHHEKLAKYCGLSVQNMYFNFVYILRSSSDWIENFYVWDTNIDHLTSAFRCLCFFERGNEC